MLKRIRNGTTTELDMYQVIGSIGIVFVIGLAIGKFLVH